MMRTLHQCQKIFKIGLIIVISMVAIPIYGQDHSIAREWNEIVLTGIRNDFARPTVHARNLFHTSIAMYDAWAAYEDEVDTYLLGKLVDGFICPFEGIATPTDKQAAQEEAISYAMYRIITKRFFFSPGAFTTYFAANQYFVDLGYDPTFVSIDYSTGNPAALGNYIASQIFAYGDQDGSNEQVDYQNQYYETVNEPMNMLQSGNPNVADPNRWQSLTLSVFIDQSGNVIPFNTPDFLSPEWGNVSPFALTNQDLTIYRRDGHEYKVYHDPGDPPYLTDDPATLPDEYKWGFSMVSIWGSHLDPDDGVMIDISPASIGNNPEFPENFEDYSAFYNYLEGGDASNGWDVNPHTGQPYEPQIVPRADYARVLAEFWADGPDSETPPGHWFTILNYVNDHPDLEKKFKGEGEVLDDLEWDIKSYFILGGTMHDAAISAWGIKGWYDYIRPVSAIRYMAEEGQSSDPSLPNYSENGIPLVQGYIELVGVNDSLAGDDGEHVGEIKLYSWRGPDYINDDASNYAGVGWILAADWWPYQRPTFVTPPFAGYVSGHSTYSRAAAEVLTMLTGDAYFPGGMGAFDADKDEFLVFEEGPSTDLVLQWATYRDASDQTSLSRIWGGIHPPADDIPGRKIGFKIGLDAFAHAERYFNGEASLPEFEEQAYVYPNPITDYYSKFIVAFNTEEDMAIDIQITNLQGQMLSNESKQIYDYLPFLTVDVSDLPNGIYLLTLIGDNIKETKKIMIMR